MSWQSGSQHDFREAAENVKALTQKNQELRDLLQAMAMSTVLEREQARAENKRLLDLACRCESYPDSGCAAHNIPAPPKCKCGHQKSMHEPGCICAFSGIDCVCPEYVPEVIQ